MLFLITVKIIHGEYAKQIGAKVLECSISVTSKGEVLEYAFSQLKGQYDAYTIFDADNVVDSHFLEKMNDAYHAGYQIAQGYRESKNGKDTWVSNSYAIYHWIQNLFLNQARKNCKMSAYITGTGFMVSNHIIEKYGFHTTTMTEDMELTIQYHLQNEKVTFIHEAITYDEQPITFQQSIKQRKRWSAGTIQCLKNYGKHLKNHPTKESFDTIMLLILPIIQIITTVVWILQAILNYLVFHTVPIIPVITGIITSNLIALLIVVLQRKSITENIKGIITFPIFVFSWIFINIASIIKPDKTWEPIQHTRIINIEAINQSIN